MQILSWCVSDSLISQYFIYPKLMIMSGLWNVPSSARFGTEIGDAGQWRTMPIPAADKGISWIVYLKFLLTSDNFQSDSTYMPSIRAIKMLSFVSTTKFVGPLKGTREQFWGRSGKKGNCRIATQKGTRGNFYDIYWKSISKWSVNDSSVLS